MTMKERDRLIAEKCARLGELGKKHQACRHDPEYYEVEVEIVAVTEALLYLIKS